MELNEIFVSKYLKVWLALGFNLAYLTELKIKLKLKGGDLK